MFGTIAALLLAPHGTNAAGAAAAAAKPAAAGKKAAPSAAVKRAVAIPADDPNAPFWSAKPSAAQFSKLQEARLARGRASVAKLVAVKGPRTIANTLQPYDDALRQLDLVGSQASLIAVVHPEESLRTAAEKEQQAASAFGTELSLNRQVFDALSSLDVSKEDDATKYYVKKTLRDFKLAGVDKDAATREKIRKLNDELVQISQEFSRNIREDKRSVKAKPEQLAGLPQDFIDAPNHKPDADGNVTLTVDYPDAIPVFSYAKNEDLRKALYAEYNNRGYPKNIDVLNRMITKRDELAHLIGFRSWADYITADKMVGSAKNAHDFIDGVAAASAARQEREYQRLLAQKQKSVPGAPAVNPWESNFYSEQVRKADYGFDSQSVRPYFQFAEVEQGVLDVTSRMFGLEFKKVPDAAVWDPSVDCYEMYADGKLQGRIYLDLHPRQNKYNHAAQFDIRTGIEGKQFPEAALVCNFPDGLMEFSDVTTFFHEFGHLIHTLLAGHQRWVGIGGIRTEQDFVEAPSQMLEEWCKDPKVLATFAKNETTHEPIPAALVEQMNRANDFGKGLGVRRQMVYAATSLDCYDRDPKSLDTTKLIEEETKKYQPFPWVDGYHWQCAFGHLDGYSAVYYTYMWSLVIAKDLFAHFDQADLLAPGAAKQYRDCVLAPGGSKPAAQLVECFLGRPFNNQAWKAWLDRGDVSTAAKATP